MASSPFDFQSAPFATEHSPFEPHSAPMTEVAAAPVEKLDAAEVETSAAAIEVVVRWGQDILHIEHLEAARPYAVGEANADFILPEEKLGTTRMDLVAMEGTAAYAVILPGSTAKITSRGRTLEVADAAAEGIATASSSHGGYKVALVDSVRVRIERAGLSFEIAAVNAGRKVAGKVGGDKKAFAGQAISIGVHGAILATMFAFMPALASTEEGEIDDSQSYMLQMLQSAEADRQLEEQETPDGERAQAEEAASPKGGDLATNEMKQAGKNVSATNKRVAISTDSKERAVDRDSLIKEAQTFGMIELLGSLSSATGGPDVPSAPWGTVASGPDATNANGAMWGDEIGDQFGWGGVDLSGTGERSGGPFKGNYMGNLNTIGNGNGDCLGTNCGQGRYTGILPGVHKPGSPSMKPGVTKTSGRLPAEVIQRVVRQNFGRFRACYEMGLRGNPNLAGRIGVSFTVGRDGSVGMVQSAGSDLPDAGVVSCVTKAFYGLSFPAPEEGVVKVTYPIVFAPTK